MKKLLWFPLCLALASSSFAQTVGPPGSSSAGFGTVTSVSVVSANGITGTVANPTTTPAITLTLGAITPTSIVGPTIDNAIIGGSTPAAGTFTTVTASGIIKTTGAGSAPAPELTIGNATTGLYSVSTTGLGFSVNGTLEADWGITTAGAWRFVGTVQAASNLTVISAAGALLLRNGGTSLTAPANNTFQIGPADAASPLAQTLQAQSVVAGNANTAGATWTLQGSLSNGSGGGGNVVLSTTQSIASSGVQNTALAGITILGGTQLVEINQISSDAGLTDTTVCQDTTLHGLHAGTGTAGICLGNVSSIHFKHDWQDISDGLGIINALDPGTYRYNEGIADGGTQLRVGFTAERYAQVLPQFTRYDNNGNPNGLDMLAAFPFAVRAIQQIDGRLTQLEKRSR